MSTAHAQDWTRGFAEETFPLENYDDSRVCNLKNENLFPISKFNIFRTGTPAARSAYALIEPEPLLISRIIIQCSPTFGIFIRRRDAGRPDVSLDADVELALPEQDIIDLVKRYIPDIEFDPDMTPNAFLEDELVEGQADLSMKRKAWKTDVQAETGSPRKRQRFRGSSSPKICGGKRVQMSAECR